MRAASANPLATLAIERILLGKLKTSHQPDPSHPIKTIGFIGLFSKRKTQNLAIVGFNLPSH
jgi:hypothetical protein